MVKICDLFDRGRPVLSFEFFPPKTDAGMSALERTVGELGPLSPSFVSVTYGAGGSTRDRTLELVGKIKNELGLEAMAHLTCVGSTRDKIRGVLDRLGELGIENILALRGDPPAGSETFQKTEGGFGYASELTGFVKSEWSFCVGGASYPESHTESDDKAADLRHTLEKVRAGADFLVTQLFFDNIDYFDHVKRARELGITVPIVPGIMPITNVGQVKRFTSMCGARIPKGLLKRLDGVAHDPAAVARVGVEHATAQCKGLLEGGAPGVHFYTLNKSPATRQIFANLQAMGVVGD